MRSGCSLEIHKAMRSRAEKELNKHLQHKDTCGNQEAKLAGSSDPQCVKKPFNPGNCFHKERSCSAEQMEVLYP